jgi:hypothetical protein
MPVRVIPEITLNYKVLVVGLAPDEGADPRRPLHPESPTGRRLCARTGLTPDEFLRAFDRANITGTRPEWQRSEAEWEGVKALVSREGLRVRFVLVGDRVARAFGHPAGMPYLTWREAAPPPLPFLKVYAAVVPDPGDQPHEIPEPLRRFWRGLAEESK